MSFTQRLLDIVVLYNLLMLVHDQFVKSLINEHLTGLIVSMTRRDKICSSTCFGTVHCTGYIVGSIEMEVFLLHDIFSISSGCEPDPFSCNPKSIPL